MEATDTTYQIVTIANGRRAVLETVYGIEAALAQQATYPFATRLMALDGLDFDASKAEHLRA